MCVRVCVCTLYHNYAEKGVTHCACDCLRLVMIVARIFLEFLEIKLRERLYNIAKLCQFIA